MTVRQRLWLWWAGVGMVASAWCVSALADGENVETKALEYFIVQLPVASLVLLVVYFFTKEMAKERTSYSTALTEQRNSYQLAIAARDSQMTATFDKRDALFTAALDRNSAALRENTEVMRELDHNVAVITARNPTDRTRTTDNSR